MTEITPEEIKEALRTCGITPLAHAALAYIEQLEARVEAAEYVMDEDEEIAHLRNAAERRNRDD